jgi:hypothetical protein
VKYNAKQPVKIVNNEVKMKKIELDRYARLIVMVCLIGFLFSCGSTPDSRTLQATVEGDAPVIPTSVPTPLDNLRRVLGSGEPATAKGVIASIEDIDSADSEGNRALHIAVWFEDEAIIRDIIVRNADLDAARNDGLTPLHLAAFRGNTRIVDLLVASGAFIDPQSDVGMTPLHWAIRQENAETSERLIYHGSDLFTRRADGLRPFDFANETAAGLRQRMYEIEKEFGTQAVSPVLRFGNVIVPHIEQHGPSVAEAFYRRGRDALRTGRPSLPPRAEATLRIPRPFDYTEQPYFEIEVESAGRGELFELVADIRLHDRLTERVFFGWLPPGETDTRRINLPVQGIDAMGTEIPITVSFSEENGNIAPSQEARIRIEQTDNRRVRQFADRFSREDIKELVAGNHIDRGAIDRLYHFGQSDFTIDDIIFFIKNRAISQDIVASIIVDGTIPYSNSDLIEIAKNNYLTRSIAESLFLQGRHFSRSELDELSRLGVFTRPTVGYAYTIQDGGSSTSDGNSDGRLQVREAADFNFRLRNNSVFDLDDIEISLSTQAAGVALFNNRQRIRQITAGGSHELTVSTVQLQPAFSADSFDLQIQISNEQFGTIEAERLRIAVGREVGDPIIALNKQVISTQRVEVYSGASAESPALQAVDRGALFEVTGELGDFYRVSIFGEDGWVSRYATQDHVPGDEEYSIVSDIAESDRFLQGVLPEAIITSPQNNARIDHNEVMLGVTAIDRQHGIERLVVWVNDRPYQGAGANGERGLVVVGQPGRVNDRVERSFQIRLQRGENRIRVVAYNSRNIASVEQQIVLESTGMRNPPRLFVLAVGVNDYGDRDLNLRYAETDARMIAEVFRSQQGKLYDEVFTRLLIDRDATRENILQELNEFVGQARTHDVVVVFLAGHGVQSRDTYYYIGHDADINNPSLRGLSQDDLQRHLMYNVDTNKSVVMLDTCQSGFIPGRRGFGPDMDDVIERLAEAEGSVFISASGGTEAARESPSWGHGAFTLAIREALQQGRARDRKGDGIIDIDTLFRYVSDRVIDLTNGEQRPKISGITEFFPIYALD